MTGPQPHRDYIPREAWPIRIGWWIVSGFIASAVCCAAWIVAVSLVDVLWDLLGVMG